MSDSFERYGDSFAGEVLDSRNFRIESCLARGVRGERENNGAFIDYRRATRFRYHSDNRPE